MKNNQKSPGSETSNDSSEKISSEEKERKADLTSKEDLSIGIMNLISIEEHLAFTAAKTKREEYLEILSLVRPIRTKLLRMIVKDPEGEVWCISKHLLASSMRFMETSTKYLGKDNKTAMDLEGVAFDLYSLFWFLQEMPKAPSSHDSEKITGNDDRVKQKKEGA